MFFHKRNHKLFCYNYFKFPVCDFDTLWSCAKKAELEIAFVKVEISFVKLKKLFQARCIVFHAGEKATAAWAPT